MLQATRNKRWKPVDEIAWASLPTSESVQVRSQKWRSGRPLQQLKTFRWPYIERIHLQVINVQRMRSIAMRPRLTVQVWRQVNWLFGKPIPICWMWWILRSRVTIICSMVSYIKGIKGQLKLPQVSPNQPSPRVLGGLGYKKIKIKIKYTHGRLCSDFLSYSGSDSFCKWLLRCKVSPADCTKEANSPTVIPTATDIDGASPVVTDWNGWSCSIIRYKQGRFKVVGWVVRGIATGLETRLETSRFSAVKLIDESTSLWLWVSSIYLIKFSEWFRRIVWRSTVEVRIKADFGHYHMHVMGQA